ncbi:serine threonine phosphatase 2A regulatory subunit B [Babesia ovis]|uniref:Serine/threonine-protein phosphatase 2A activator n=1 Tax=Babesia ovis TaxID=5869 RepID=A0A9W5TA45_BABOV|nr:serine threonine phosphatase 2A regulatory subunit B [Babesia ovis]
MSSAVFPQGPSGIDCSDVRAFIQKLNEAAMDRVIPSDLDISTVAHRINTMLATIRQMTNQHKPEDYTGCRYGSKAHTAWIKDVEELMMQKWDDIAKTLQIGESITLPYKIRDIRRYFLHSFGNPMRIDYGTGHEMQFVLFLKTLYDTGIVEDRDLPEVALTVMSSYFQLVQHLIDRYNLEPAGSKGAWGLDHFQFMPFLLGSAQLVSNDNILPSQVVDPATVLEQTDKYIFLQTVDYIKRVRNFTPDLICGIEN